MSTTPTAGQLQQAREARAVAFKDLEARAAKMLTPDWIEDQDAPTLEAAQRAVDHADLAVQRLERILEQRAAFAASTSDGAVPPASGISVSINTSGHKPDNEQGLRQAFRLQRAIQIAANPQRAMDGAELEAYQEADKEARAVGVDIAPNCNVRVPGFLNPKLQHARDLTAGTAATAGNLVATDLEGLIPLLEPRLFAEKMGATMFRGLVGNVDFPRQTTDVAAAWASTETAAATESDPNTDKISMSPKRLSATVDITDRLMIQASIDVENWIRRRCNFAVQQALNTAIISGTGASGQPTGILVAAGVNDITLGANGAALTWANVIQFMTEIFSDNAELETLGYLCNPATFGKLLATERFTGSNGQAIASGAGEKRMVGDYQAQVSQLMPSNLSKGASSGILSAMIFGNWSELYIGQWGGLSMIVNPYTQSKNAIVEVTVHSYWDLALAHAVSFCKCDEIITT